jgi:hypothetical protein
MSDTPPPDDDWYFGLQLPDGWVTAQLELPDGDRRDALRDDIDQLVTDEPGLRHDVDRMKVVAVDMTDRAVEHDAMASAVGFDLVDGAAVAMAISLHRLAADGDVDLDVLAETLSVPDELDVNPRDVEVVDLPAGPSVRVHTITEGGPASEAAGVPVIERVDYLIPVPGRPELLYVTCSTPSVAVGDLITPTFDAMAETVTIDVPGAR